MHQNIISDAANELASFLFSTTLLLKKPYFKEFSRSPSVVSIQEQQNEERFFVFLAKNPLHFPNPSTKSSSHSHLLDGTLHNLWLIQGTMVRVWFNVMCEASFN